MSEAQYVQLEYGTFEGRLVHISVVERGVACGCVCPSCGQGLVAKKGDVRREHFAHYHDRECSGALESAIHMFAKQVLVEKRSLSLPSLIVTQKAPNETLSRVVIPQHAVVFDRVELEVRKEGYIPDAVAWIKSRCMFVEFRNTHEVSPAKLELLISDDVSTVEIDLRPLLALSQWTEADILEKAPRTWLHHRRSRDAQRQIDEEAEVLRLAEDAKKLAQKKAQEDERVKAEQRKVRAAENREPALVAAQQSRLRERFNDCDLIAHTAATLRDSGLVALTGKLSKSDWVLDVPPHHWQSEFLMEFVYPRPGDRFIRSFKVEDVSKWLAKRRFANPLHIYITNDNLKYVQTLVETFEKPQTVVAWYVDFLRGRNILTEALSFTEPTSATHYAYGNLASGMQVFFERIDCSSCWWTQHGLEQPRGADVQEIERFSVVMWRLNVASQLHIKLDYEAELKILQDVTHEYKSAFPEDIEFITYLRSIRSWSDIRSGRVQQYFQV